MDKKKVMDLRSDSAKGSKDSVASFVYGKKNNVTTHAHTMVGYVKYPKLESEHRHNIQFSKLFQR